MVHYYITRGRSVAAVIAAVMWLITASVGAESRAPQSVGLQDLTAHLVARYGAKGMEDGVYVGTQFCLACHSDQASHQETLHARFLRRPLEQYSLIDRRGVNADSDDNNVDDFVQGLDFNEIDSPFDRYKPNAPVLSELDGEYFISISSLRLPVTFTVAGHDPNNAQRYVVKIPLTDSPTGLSVSNYFAPLQYTASGWTPNSPQNWYDDENQPRWNSDVSGSVLEGHGGNYSATCVGCHTTGIRSIATDPLTSEFAFEGFVAVLFESGDETVFDYDGDGNFDLMNVGCESCHGTGSRHILARGDPEQIVNPADLAVVAQVDVCGRCHSRPRSVPDGLFPWPYDDAAGADLTPDVIAAGAAWAEFAVDDSVRWPDGKHGRITRPYHDYLESGKSTFQFKQVSCTDCHDPHAEDQPYQVRTEITENGVQIATRIEDNSLCLGCHAGFGPFAELATEMIADIDENLTKIRDVTEAHTHHPYGPERRLGLSRCTGCHMPPMSGFGALTTPSHTFEAVGPEKTLLFQDEGGMPNACAISCHGRSVDILGLGLDPNPDNTVWNEAFDRALAEELLKYFGPDGQWWNTESD